MLFRSIEDFKHLIEKEILLKDPILIYKSIVNYFAGHQHHHIETAKLVLEAHRFGSGIITLSISELREKLHNFEIAQVSATTAQYKMGILKNIKKDKNDHQLLKYLMMRVSADLILRKHWNTLLSIQN